MSHLHRCPKLVARAQFRYRRLTLIPWEPLGAAVVPGGDKMTLQRRGGEYSLRVENFELMNSRQHDSEERLAEFALAARGSLAAAHVLVGGLGMGFTVRAALDLLPGDARVSVAELVPEVVEWNREHLGHLAGRPLDDPRVGVVVDDVAAVLRRAKGAFDVVVVDTDNGPEGTSHDDNDWLYSDAGLAATKRALKRGGVFGVWSAFHSEPFTKRLRKAGFAVEVKFVRSRGKKGNRHVIWVAEARG